jgi:hypothetical protein
MTPVLNRRGNPTICQALEKVLALPHLTGATANDLAGQKTG